MKSPQIFDDSAVDRIMADLLQSFQDNCFSEAPSIPKVVESEVVSEFESEATSTGQKLEARPFSAPPIHIPNAGEGANARHSFKSELSLQRDANAGTRKMLWWHSPDPREIPHNHPWDFRSAILSGGYTEERYSLVDGVWVREVIEYGVGSVNVVSADVYHNVIAVEPDTVTFLDCGPARKGNEWGYLDVNENEYFDWKEQSPDNFLEIFKTLNAH